MQFHKRYCLPESIIIIQLHYEAEDGFFWSPVLVMLTHSLAKKSRTAACVKSNVSMLDELGKLRSPRRGRCIFGHPPRANRGGSKPSLPVEE